MATITNTFKKIDQSAPRDFERTVKISLVYDQATQAIPIALTSPEFSPFGTLEIRTDSDGTWEAELIDNSIIVPEGSAYKVVEGYGDSKRTYFIEVADTDADVKDILVAEPNYGV